MINHPPQVIVNPKPPRCDNCGGTRWRARSTLKSADELRRYLKCVNCGRKAVSSESVK